MTGAVASLPGYPASVGASAAGTPADAAGAPTTPFGDVLSQEQAAQDQPGSSAPGGEESASASTASTSDDVASAQDADVVPTAPVSPNALLAFVLPVPDAAGPGVVAASGAAVSAETSTLSEEEAVGGVVATSVTAVDGGSADGPSTGSQGAVADLTRDMSGSDRPPSDDGASIAQVATGEGEPGASAKAVSSSLPPATASTTGGTSQRQGSAADPAPSTSPPATTGERSSATTQPANAPTATPPAPTTSTTTAPTTPTLPVRTAEPVHAIVHLTTLLRGGAQAPVTARVELHPLNLGAVTVVLRQAAGEGLTAHLRAERPEAVAALQAVVPDLVAQLADEGVDVQRLEVTALDAPDDAEQTTAFTDPRDGRDGRDDLGARARSGEGDAGRERTTAAHVHLDTDDLDLDADPTAGTASLRGSGLVDVRA